MSRVYITASSDTSIYERYANLNTGQDEILEVGKKQDNLDLDKIINILNSKEVMKALTLQLIVVVI